MEIGWTIEGEKQLSRYLREVENSLKDFTVPFKRASDTLKNTFSTEVFETEGSEIGERWERLSPYTVAQKARSGYGGKGILERTGSMRRSFKTIVSSDQAVIFNTAEYFGYHQSNRPRRKLPRRVMMKLADNQKEMIVKEFQRYIKGVVQK